MKENLSCCKNSNNIETRNYLLLSFSLKSTLKKALKLIHAFQLLFLNKYLCHYKTNSAVIIA